MLRAPGVIAESAIGYAALGAVFYWWLGFAETGGLALLLSVATVALLASGAVVLTRRARQRLASGERAGAMGGVISVLVLLAALAIAYWLVWWVPEFTGFTAQAASMAIRWGAGYLLVVLAWLNLLAATSEGKPLESQPSTASLP
ncbi:MAG: hypothetical protein R2762_03610 [Bryobacteraceae bacterium]